MREALWQRGRAIDSGQCRMCGTTVGQRHFWPEVYANSGQQLRRCAHCAGVYLAPGFTEEGLDEFYAVAYRRLFPAEIPWHSTERFFRWRGDRIIARQRLQLIAPTLAPGDNLFELGPGFGAFLAETAMQRPDLQLSASEPDVANRTALLGQHKVHFVEGLDTLEPGSLQGLVAFHTLEHVIDPLTTLDLAARALSPDGQLWIEVPDLFGDWTSRLYVHPAHLSYFCRDSLRNLAMAAGFEVLSCGPHPLSSLSGNLWLHARRPAQLLQRPLRAEAEQVIQAIDSRISRVGWGARDVLRALAKRMAIRVFGPGAVGEWQRWRHRQPDREQQK